MGVDIPTTGKETPKTQEKQENALNLNIQEQYKKYENQL